MEKRMVVKRDGTVIAFDAQRIRNAMAKAIRATQGRVEDESLDQMVQEIIESIENQFPDSYPNVEQIQDRVEQELMRHQLYDVAKAYILYRAERTKAREETKKQTLEKTLSGQLRVQKRNGAIEAFDLKKIRASLQRASKGFEREVSIDLVLQEVMKTIFDGITADEIDRALILATTAFIEQDPAHSYVSGRLYLQKIYKEVIGKSISHDALGLWYREAFVQGIRNGVNNRQLDARLLEFDLEQLSFGLKPERDQFLQYLGLQTLYERYFLRNGQQRAELPQAFWMRVAMGIALGESKKTEKALEFYETMSSLRYIPSTPTLFHSGSIHPQLSSCYITTINDDLDHIFKSLWDNARLSKWSGGVGNDWSNIRATGAHIKSTNVESQGVIPFLKIANDVTCAINRSGKRRGATCAYLETWHMDIEEFLDLRKNTGDDRRRTHDMSTANWIPDLFMKRVEHDELWTLFSADETPELHHLYGKRFEKKYVEYEAKAQKGELTRYKTVSARKLWRKMLGMLFETGHPWLTFKDPCNIRSPQDHCGVIHSSNLCTEITLNTSDEETAVCNLGSINLEKHIENGQLNTELLKKTIRTAMRMLDNVIDINFYPTIEAQNANYRHRPVGLGIMALQDALFKLNIAFDSPQATQFCDEIMEFISYYAILGSSELAKERGTYESYGGSKWSRGILPLDSISLLEEERGMRIEVNRHEHMDWNTVRNHIRQFGMRNSNTMAIAPTATIANIAGCYPCTEPIYKNIYVKSNMSGEFTVVNSYLVQDLKKAGLWNKEMLDQLKYYDGNLQLMTIIPAALKEKYKEAFDIDPLQDIAMAAVRSKWIDQSQSHNVFMKGNSGSKLHEIYIAAWKSGLKTTYYLRTLAASQIEKSTLDAQKFGFTQKRDYKSAPITTASVATLTTEQNATELENPPIATTPPIILSTGKICRLDDPGCEACQ